MISNDRRDLNDRFIQAFKILEERGDVIKNDRGGKGLGDFAERIVGNRAYGHIVRAFLNEDDKRCISYEQARKVCHEYGVNYNFLLEGEGTPFGMDLATPDEADIVYNGNILYTDMEAFAGVSIGVEKFENNDFFAIPGINGSGLVAFPIKGNSMEPVINDEDIVICREIAGVHEIKDNKIYAVRNNGSIWVKYVQRIQNEKGRVTHLKLISANHLEYDPFNEDVNEHTRLYEVIRRVSSL